MLFYAKSLILQARSTCSSAKGCTPHRFTAVPKAPGSSRTAQVPGFGSLPEAQGLFIWKSKEQTNAFASNIKPNNFSTTPIKQNYTSIDPKQFFKHRVCLQRPNLGSHHKYQGNWLAGMQYKRVGCAVMRKNFTWWCMADKVWRCRQSGLKADTRRDTTRDTRRTQGGHRRTHRGQGPGARPGQPFFF